jgi:ribosomal protein S18 acetylase RimI-like enzyme
MEYIIREMEPAEYPLLNDFLYQAIFIPEGMQPPPYEIIFQPELQVYTQNFGTSPHDRALAAAADGRIVGAVWVRIMHDYGHIDADTPSFAIALDPEYRGQGIGTALMREMLETLRKAGYRQASLSVQKANYAERMYRKLGFQIIGENDGEYLMRYLFRET